MELFTSPFSGHSLVYVVRRLISPRERPRIIETRNYKNFETAHFLEDLSNVPWDTVENLEDPNEMFLFNTVLNAHAPLKTKRVRNTEAP